MALKPIREMQYAENIGNPVFITDLAVLSQNIVELKAAINMFGKTTAIIYGFDKTEGGYTPGIVLQTLCHPGQCGYRGGTVGQYR